MQKRKIKVGLFPSYPMVNEACNLKFPSMRFNCLMPGMIVEIYKIIANDLNLEIEAYDYSNKTFSSLISDFNDGTIDLNGFLRERSIYYDDVYEYSEPLYEVSTRLVVRRQDTSLKMLFDFFNVFNLRVWTMFAISFFLFTTIGLIVRFVEWRLLLRHRLDFFELVWRMARLQLIQHEQIEHKLISGNLYNSSITSAAVKAKITSPFESKDLIKVLREKRYSLASLAGGGWIFEMINTSFASPYYEIRDVIVNNKVQDFPNPHAILEAVNSNQKIAVARDDDEVAFLADRDYCDLVYLRSPFQTFNQRIRMLKGHSLMLQINQSILANRVSIKRIYEKYKNYRGFEADSHCDRLTRGPKILKLQPYLGVLTIYGIGLTFAVLVFSGEVLTRR